MYTLIVTQNDLGSSAHMYNNTIRNLNFWLYESQLEPIERKANMGTWVYKCTPIIFARKSPVYMYDMYLLKNYTPSYLKCTCAAQQGRENPFGCC